MTRHTLYVGIADRDVASGSEGADRLRAAFGPSVAVGDVELDPEADGIQVAAGRREALEAAVRAAVSGGVFDADVARRLHEDVYEVDEQDGFFEGDARPFEMSPLL
jgi:hypothetical protein